MKILASLALSIICTAVSACSMQGVRHFEIVDREGTAINEVTIVPRYAVNVGVGVGADGQGPHSYYYVVTGPFLFNSGENIIENHPRSNQVLIPGPYTVVTGKGYRGIRWLLLKQGYQKKLVDEELMYSHSRVHLKQEEASGHGFVVNALLASPVSQKEIKALFDLNWLKHEVQVDFSEKDRALLLRVDG